MAGGGSRSDLGKVGIQVTRGRLVQQDAKPFLIENIGNYQREMIYLTGGRIGEMQRIILKLYDATPHPSHRDLGVRRLEPDADNLQPASGNCELVYVGYPDRPTAAKKVEELARLAETLDGTGYGRLVVLAWDYDYSYDEAWDARTKTSPSSAKPLKIDIPETAHPARRVRLPEKGQNRSRHRKAGGQDRLPRQTVPKTGEAHDREKRRKAA